MKNLSSENKCRMDASTAGWILARVLAMAADAGELTGHVNTPLQIGGCSNPQFVKNEVMLSASERFCANVS